MSPPAESQPPRTPDRRSSSSALYGAFRALTVGRLKSPTPPPSASSASYTPARPSSLVNGLGSATQSALGSLKRMAEPDGAQHARLPLGGPPELAELAEQLRSKHAFADRRAAVDAICHILEHYPVQNVLPLWSRASDLLLPEQSDDAADAGYRLLKACVALPKLTPLEHSVFFDAAALRSNDASFDKRLDIVSTLTRGGRDIDACAPSLPHFILTSFDSCFRHSVHAHRLHRKASRSKHRPDQAGTNLGRLFQYTVDVCKFNSRVFSEHDLDLLLKKAMDICRRTTQSRDIANAVVLFNTIITYVYVPKISLRPCLEVLCLVHRQIVDLHDQTWTTLSNLLKSHVGHAAVSALLQTLSEGPMGKNRETSIYRGTIEVLRQVLLESGRNGLPVIPIPLLFPALETSIHQPLKSQEDFVIDLIDALFAQDNLRGAVLTEADWSHLIRILYTCAERDDERVRDQATKSSSKVASAAGTHSPKPGMNGTQNAAASMTGDAETDVISNLNLPVSSIRQEITSRGPRDGIFHVLVKLDSLSQELDFVQKDALMELFLRLAHRLSDTTVENLLNYYTQERSLHPSNEGWLETTRSLVFGITKDSTRPRSLRLMSIKALRETYNTLEILCGHDSVMQCAVLLLEIIEFEEDVAVLHELVDFAVDVADRASHANFSDTVDLLKRRLQRSAVTSQASLDIGSPTSSVQENTERLLGSPCNVVTTGFVRLFTRSVMRCAQKTRILYDLLRHIARTDSYESDARLTVLRLLFRLRADSEHALFVSASSEGESLAGVLCRTEATATVPDNEDGLAADHSRHEDHSSWREQRKSSGSPHASLTRLSGRYSNAAGRVSKPIPPLWMYPGPKGLPEEPSPEVSRVVFSHTNAEHHPLSPEILDLEVTLWLELVISLLQRSPDWEIYSYVVVHLGPQLSNQSLVRSCIPQLKMLRSVLCEQIRNSSFRDPPAHTLLKKADVAACLFHILTVLISYHDHFEKSEDDDLVKAFIHGMGHWDRTSKWCIHALSVCCHEVPLSVSKSLDIIVQKMSQIVMKPETAVHILDFLTSLARMPELYKNFREDEFKMVFGVSFRYLQHLRDQRERVVAANTNQRSLRHSGVSREFASSPDPLSRKTKLFEDGLPQYLYSLAYHVIAFWFMALKMEDRPKLMPWIARSLRFTDSMGRQAELEEQGQVIVDMMNMVSYSDCDETMRDANFAKPGDGELWKKTWIVGHSIITIETAARTGVSQVSNRRACGTRHIFLRPLLAPPPRHQAPITIGLASEAFYSSSWVGILPDDIFQTFYASLNSTIDPPIPLPDNDMTRRAIATFDRISAVDTYKVGVIYIAEGQTHERAILMNDMGSPAYTAFLKDLGTLCRLQSASFNTGGLDTRDNSDGEFTYCWRDRCIELVFHVTTLMPTDSADDMTYPNKKRHIGNDFVNIIFNDSGLPYNFGTFPSAFNYVHIVIEPEARASFVRRRSSSHSNTKSRYFKIQVISKPGFPDISPAAETKILAGKHVAAYCRLIAINASVFSQVWFGRDGGETNSSWRNRLREIQRLRERYGAVTRDATLLSASPVGIGGFPSPVEGHGPGKSVSKNEGDGE